MAGTVSYVSGGKFANGALSGAFRFMFNDAMHFNGKELKHYDDDGNLLKTYRATSGRVDTTPKDQNQKNIGPIPEGDYYIDPSEISEVNGLRYFARQLQGDWGHYRVRLHQLENTNTYGRDNFFLHGGSYPGSAGCIDVGKYDSMLFGGFNALKSHSGNISLKVRYE